MANLLYRGAIQKQSAVRSKKLIGSAKGQLCTAEILGYCNNNPETVVFAHFPSSTKGIGIKSDDFWGGYCCDACHAVIDGRIPYNWKQGEKLELMLRMLHKSLKIMFEQGVIIIK